MWLTSVSRCFGSLADTTWPKASQWPKASHLNHIVRLIWNDRRPPDKQRQFYKAEPSQVWKLLCRNRRQRTDFSLGKFKFFIAYLSRRHPRNPAAELCRESSALPSSSHYPTHPLTFSLGLYLLVLLITGRLVKKLRLKFLRRIALVYHHKL